MSDGKKRVCIIGAGASGLCCMRYFKDNPETFTVVSYEQSSKIGGLWNYSDETGTDANGYPVHSSIYSSLIVNTPKEIMAFPDFSYDSNLPSFFGHADVLRYLKKYADHFQLHQYIKFNSRVVSVKPELVGEGLWGTKWNVQIQPSDDVRAKTQQSTFDAVVICNGHQAVPNYPHFDGLSDFKGLQMHGKNYRHANMFKDMTVFTIGASFSGWDITLDVSHVAKQLYISHHGDHRMKKYPNNVEMVPGVRKFTKNGAVMTDGRELTFDAVIFNTGYKYSFPFLSPDCGVEITKDNTIQHLYKHTLNIAHPTLSFITFLDYLIPFPCMSLQARFVKAALEGGMELPSEENMRQAEQHEIQKRRDLNWKPSHLHNFEGFQDELFAEFAMLSGCDPLPPWWNNLCNFYFPTLFDDLAACKRVNYKVIEPDSFEYTKA